MTLLTFAIIGVFMFYGAHHQPLNLTCGRPSLFWFCFFSPLTILKMWSDVREKFLLFTCLISDCFWHAPFLKPHNIKTNFVFNLIFIRKLLELHPPKVQTPPRQRCVLYFLSALYWNGKQKSILNRKLDFFQIKLTFWRVLARLQRNYTVTITHTYSE